MLPWFLFGALLVLLYLDKGDKLARRRRQLERLYRQDAANRK